MNEIAQKRINDYREKVAAAINNSLGIEISEEARARLVLMLANTRLSQFEGTVFSYLQNHLDFEDAILAGARYDSEEIEQFFYDKLNDYRTPHRDIIVEQLGLKKKLASVSRLAEYLKDEDRQVRFQAAYGLYSIGGKDAALAMCNFISDSDEWISMNILRLLCIMREHETIPILTEKFHQDDDLRRKALMVSFLARFKSVTLISIFDEGIKARDARLKANSIEAIGNLNLPEKEIRSRIEPFLRDPNNRIRANAILAIAKSDPEKIKPEIKEMVESNDVQLRRSAAFILGMIPPAGYEDLATKLVIDQNEAVRKRMVQSLRNFPNEFVCSQVEQAVSDSNKWIRKHAIDMACRIKDFPDAKILALLKTERAAPNLESCMNFFASHPTQEAMSALKLHVKDRRHQVVKALLGAMAAIGGVSGVKSIAPRLDQRDPKVIRLLTEVLVKAGEKKILEDLIERFSQSRFENQITALAPSIDACLEILALGEAIPEPLMRSLETIAIEEKPLPPPVVEKPVSSAEMPDLDLSSTDLSMSEGETDSPDLQIDLSELPASPEEKSEPALPGLDLDLPAVELEDRKPRKKVSPHYVRGMKAYNLGKFSKAMVEFNALIESGEEFPDKIYLYMGIMHAENNKFEHARAFLETYLKDNPDSSKANYLYGKVMKELKNWDALIKVYSRFTRGEIDASPKMKKQVYRELGIANVLVGKYERGYQLLETLFKVESDNPEVGYYLALAQFHLHKPSAAASLLDQVIKNSGKNPRIQKLAEALITKVRSGSRE
ncbi:MAG: HEAT repeat domain-containing protein [Candidatus Riflebacteria bacterium]